MTSRDGVEIYYKDKGPKNAQPRPFTFDDWDTQMLYFVGQGYRVVAHDRRGHVGHSTGGGEARRYVACRPR